MDKLEIIIAHRNLAEDCVKRAEESLSKLKPAPQNIRYHLLSREKDFQDGINPLLRELEKKLESENTIAIVSKDIFTRLPNHKREGKNVYPARDEASHIDIVGNTVYHISEYKGN